MAGGNTCQNRLGIDDILSNYQINDIECSKYNKDKNHNVRIIKYKLKDSVFNRTLYLNKKHPLTVININGEEILILHLVLTQKGGVSKQICYYWNLIGDLSSQFSKCILFLEGYDDYASNEYAATLTFFKEYKNVSIITSISNLSL